MSYFPGCDYWPPESLAFDPPFLNIDHEETNPNPSSNANANPHTNVNSNQNTTGATFDALGGFDSYDLQIRPMNGFETLQDHNQTFNPGQNSQSEWLPY
jgi:hypothetical protein